MELEMIGIDHSLADVRLRERFAFTTAAATSFMQKVKENPAVSGCILLATCNRMELYVSVKKREVFPALPMLCEEKGVKTEQAKEAFVTRRGEDVVRHLFFLASGLKSQVLGEDQILTQVKEALSRAREAECTDSALEVLFRMAVTAGKEVKTKVPLHRGNYSAAHQMIDGLKAEGYTVEGKKCLVIGNGEMGKIAATLLIEEGGDVTVTVRQYCSGVVMIPQGCRRMEYGQRYTYMPECDLIVSATASPNVTIRANEVRAFAKQKEQIFLDLAVPRDIEPEVGQIPQKRCLDMDDFRISHRSAEMEEQFEKASALLEEHIKAYQMRKQNQDLLPKVHKAGDFYANELCWRLQKPLQQSDAPKELEKTVKQAAEKVVERLLFTLRKELEPEQFRACMEVLENEYERE
ncbi:MAG: glutamyl-tRNA reductase [Lachnospiraceae bacterium]